MDRRARWIMLCSIAALTAGIAWGVWYHFTAHVEIRIGIREARIDNAEIIAELDKWLAKNNRRTRVTAIKFASEEDSLKALVEGRVEMASVRADTPRPDGISSAIMLYREVALFVTPPGSSVDEWSELDKKTIGVIGSTPLDDPLLEKLLKSKDVSGIAMVHLEPDQIAAAVKAKKVQVLSQVRPISDEDVKAIRRTRALRSLQGKLSLIEVPDAESIAAADNRYQVYEIAAGAIRPSPPFPEEEATSLAVVRHLMVSDKMQAISVQKTIRDLMDAKRAVGATIPLARQMGSPGVEKDAAVPVHEGATLYFNGEEISLINVLMEWIYIVPMVIGGIGAALTWLYNKIWPAEMMRAQNTVIDLLVLRRTAAQVQDPERFHDLVRQRNALQHDIDEELQGGNLQDKMITALLVAADAVDRQIERLARLYPLPAPPEGSGAGVQSQPG